MSAPNRLPGLRSRQIEAMKECQIKLLSAEKIKTLEVPRETNILKNNDIGSNISQNIPNSQLERNKPVVNDKICDTLGDQVPTKVPKRAPELPKEQINLIRKHILTQPKMTHSKNLSDFKIRSQNFPNSKNPTGEYLKVGSNQFDAVLDPTSKQIIANSSSTHSLTEPGMSESKSSDFESPDKCINNINCSRSLVVNNNLIIKPTPQTIYTNPPINSPTYPKPIVDLLKSTPRRPTMLSTENIKPLTVCPIEELKVSSYFLLKKTCEFCNCTIKEEETMYLRWQNICFCGTVCLNSYQQENLPKYCTNCLIEIPRKSFGNYVYRSTKVLQFCSLDCFHFYENNSNRCMYCFNNITAPSEYSQNFCHKCYFKQVKSEDKIANPLKKEICELCNCQTYNSTIIETSAGRLRICQESCGKWYYNSNNIVQSFCDVCKMSFHKLDEIKVSYKGVISSVCSKECENHIYFSHAELLSCNYCKLVKCDIDLIERCSRIEPPSFFCSISCYMRGYNGITDLLELSKDQTLYDCAMLKRSLSKINVATMCSVQKSDKSVLANQEMMEKSTQTYLKLPFLVPVPIPLPLVLPLSQSTCEKVSQDIRDIVGCKNQVHIQEVTDKAVGIEASSESAINISKIVRNDYQEMETVNACCKDFKDNTKILVTSDINTNNQNTGQEDYSDQPLTINNEPYEKAETLVPSDNSVNVINDKVEDIKGITETTLDHSALVTIDNSLEDKKTLKMETVKPNFDDLTLKVAINKTAIICDISTEFGHSLDNKKDSTNITENVNKKSKDKTALTNNDNTEHETPDNESANSNAVPNDEIIPDKTASLPGFNWEKLVVSNKETLITRVEDKNAEGMVQSAIKSSEIEFSDTIKDENHIKLDNVKCDDILDKTALQHTNNDDIMKPQVKRNITNNVDIKDEDITTQMFKPGENNNGTLVTKNEDVQKIRPSKPGDKNDLIDSIKEKISNSIHQVLIDINKAGVTNEVIKAQSVAAINNMLAELIDKMFGKYKISDAIFEKIVHAIETGFEKMSVDLDDHCIKIDADTDTHNIVTLETADETSDLTSDDKKGFNDITLVSDEKIKPLTFNSSLGVHGLRSWMKASDKYSSKTDSLLEMSITDLAECLTGFVSELKKPTGKPYSPDTVFYLCLCIQKYLEEHGYVINIFFDKEFRGFVQNLDKHLTAFSRVVLEKSFIETRVEEEHLWQSNMLGMHNPYVLLNTILYHNMKYFRMVNISDNERKNFSVEKVLKKKSNSDPHALPLAIATMQGCQLIGMPEADVLLAQCAIYLARAPKSREADTALARAKQLIQQHKGPQPVVPMHIRNAPTKLMKELGYGQLREDSEFTFMPPEYRDVTFFN